jgi:hypothetical protein
VRSQSPKTRFALTQGEIEQTPVSCIIIAGHVVKEQVQLFDVMPTILELSHKDGSSRPTTKNTHFARSLVPQLKGASGDPARIIYAEAGFLYPAELEPLHSGGPMMADSSDPHSLEWPRRQEELEGCPQVLAKHAPHFSPFSNCWKNDHCQNRDKQHKER